MACAFGRSFGVDPLRVTSVGEVMTTDVLTIPATATVAEARALFATAGHSAYPVVDADGGVVAMLTRIDLLQDASSDDTVSVLDLASREPVTVAPEQPAERAVDVMLEEGSEHVPVVDGDRLVGIVTRTDLLRVRERSHHAERRQPGWLAASR